MKLNNLIITEIVLVFASVLIFRSLWSLMDMIPVLKEWSTHITLLIAGTVITVIALYLYNKK
ncbi:MAG: hypothetical protein PHW96_02190 [Candidatus Nanoarchaeia archaeon]|nr:hypothetical protein [Candidatus Nanoarchaeia archaeon]